MKILVTGGTGFIGSHTCVELIEAGHEVVIIDNLYNSKIEVLDYIKEITGTKPKFYKCDLLDIEAMRKVFNENSFDAVIHFAGYKAVGESVVKPMLYYQNNIVGSLNLYQVMKEFDVKKIVFSSSATVYGNDYEPPFKEEFGRGTTTNPYGTTKAMNEQILSDLAYADKDMSVVLLRYFNPIGAHPSGLIGEVPNGIPNNLLPYIAKVAKGTLPYLSIFGNDYDTKDGTGVRDYIHVVDLAKAHVKALDYAEANKWCEAINIGTGVGYSVLEILHAYELACGHEIPYKICDRRAGDIATCYADTSKAKKLLGFETKLNLEDMCRDSYHFYSMQK